MDVEITEVVDFLAGCVPFDTLDRSELRSLVPRLGQRYHRRGGVIVSPWAENDALHVVRSGLVEVCDPDGTLLETRDVGDSCGFSTLASDGPSRFLIQAAEDSLVLEIPRTVFDDLSARHPGFRAFFAGESDRMRGELVSVRVDASGGDALSTPVSELLARDAVSSSSSTPVRDAARLMSDERVSSLLVVDAGRLVGIVSDRDLRSRVLAEDRPLSTPVADVMTTAPVHIGAATRAFDATLLMMERGVRHLPVLDDDGRPVGVITSTDLLRLAQADPIYLAARIARAASADAVAEQVRKLPAMTGEWERRGFAPADTARVITATADAATRRLLELAQERLGPPPVPFCWVVLGSQARGELGVASDQDSALVLATRPADDSWFAEVTAFVRDGLADAGFPVCPGDMMASNPRWRMTVEEWSEQIDTWVHQSESGNVLDAQVALDMRAVAGETDLCGQVTARLLETTRHGPRFLAHLARTAADWQPPIGFFRGLVVEKRGEYRNTLDVKAGGLSAIVQMARLRALAAGFPQVGTVERLEAVRDGGAMAEPDARSLLLSFDYLRHLQLRHHARLVAEGREPDNHIDPSTLSSRERHRLRLAFRAIAEQQEALALRYPIRQM